MKLLNPAVTKPVTEPALHVSSSPRKVHKRYSYNILACNPYTVYMYLYIGIVGGTHVIVTCISTAVVVKNVCFNMVCKHCVPSILFAMMYLCPQALEAENSSIRAKLTEALSSRNLELHALSSKLKYVYNVIRVHI